MALKIMHPAATSPHRFYPFCITTKILKIERALLATHSINKMNSRFCAHPVWIRNFGATKASEQGFAMEEEEVQEKQTDFYSIDQIKESLYDAVQGINRGIFGVQSEVKAKIERFVKQLESQNPTPEPTQNLEKMAGKWKLVYCTITILGAKRTKLGLRDFITLGDFLQIIDVSEGKAVNVIEFSARGLNLLNGQLKIEATFNIASNAKVDITYNNSSITPDVIKSINLYSVTKFAITMAIDDLYEIFLLMNVFKKNYDLLLRIFNPEGWLDITYVDETLRIGRDDKGNIFVLERTR